MFPLDKKEIIDNYTDIEVDDNSPRAQNTFTKTYSDRDLSFLLNKLDRAESEDITVKEGDSPVDALGSTPVTVPSPTAHDLDLNDTVVLDQGSLFSVASTVLSFTPTNEPNQIPSTSPRCDDTILSSLDVEERLDQLNHNLKNLDSDELILEVENERPGAASQDNMSLAANQSVPSNTLDANNWISRLINENGFDKNDYPDIHAALKNDLMRNYDNIVRQEKNVGGSMLSNSSSFDFKKPITLSDIKGKRDLQISSVKPSPAQSVEQSAGPTLNLGGRNAKL